jgi:hypothetical protein
MSLSVVIIGPSRGDGLVSVFQQAPEK